MAITRQQQNSDFKQTYMFVWLGNPIRPALKEKIETLIEDGHSVKLLIDERSIVPEKKAEFDQSINEVKGLGCELIPINVRLKNAKKKDSFSELKKYGFTKKEIRDLRRAYYFHLYGHDYYTDRKPYINGMHQNLAAASDIVRLLGLVIQQKASAKNQKEYFTYLDHDVMPLTLMNEDPKTPFQVHHLSGDTSVVSPTVTNPKQKVGLNNAVIRVDNETDFCLQTLLSIAERAKKFFAMPEDIQAISTFKHPSCFNLRMRTTFYMTGPHNFETFAHTGSIHFSEQNLLLGEEVTEDSLKYYQDMGDYHFTNESAKTWLGKYKFEKETYDADYLSEREFLYKLGEQLKILSPLITLDSVKLDNLDENLEYIRRELLKFGLPTREADEYNPNKHSLPYKFQLLCAFTNPKQCEQLLDLITDLPKDHPIEYLKGLYLQDRRLAFSFLKDLVDLSGITKVLSNEELNAKFSDPAQKHIAILNMLTQFIKKDSKNFALLQNAIKLMRFIPEKQDEILNNLNLYKPENRDLFYLNLNLIANENDPNKIEHYKKQISTTVSGLKLSSVKDFYELSKEANGFLASLGSKFELKDILDDASYIYKMFKNKTIADVRTLYGYYGDAINDNIADDTNILSKKLVEDLRMSIKKFDYIVEQTTLLDNFQFLFDLSKNLKFDLTPFYDELIRNIKTHVTSNQKSKTFYLWEIFNIALKTNSNLITILAEEPQFKKMLQYASDVVQLKINSNKFSDEHKKIYINNLQEIKQQLSYVESIAPTKTSETGFFAQSEIESKNESEKSHSITIDAMILPQKKN